MGFSLVVSASAFSARTICNVDKLSSSKILFLVSLSDAHSLREASNSCKISTD